MLHGGLYYGLYCGPHYGLYIGLYYVLYYGLYGGLYYGLYHWARVACLYAYACTTITRNITMPCKFASKIWDDLSLKR